MDDQQSAAEPRPSQALTPPDGKSTEGMQQVNPDASASNANVQPSPSTALRKPPAKRRFLPNVLKSIRIGFWKLWILIWKNLLLRKRAWISLIFHVLACLWCGFMMIIGGPVGSAGVTREGETSPTKFEQREMIEKFKLKFSGKKILYAPENMPRALDILNEINTAFFTPTTSITWTGKTSETKVQDEFNKMFTDSTYNFAGAIIFEKLEDTKVSYKIRMVGDKSIIKPETHLETDALFSSNNLPGPNSINEKAYHDAGILGLQLLIDDFALKIIRDQPTGLTPEVTLKSFPYPPYTKMDKITLVLLAARSTLFALFFFQIYLWSNYFLAKNVGGEKETGVKELMKLCGYPGWMQWFAWYLVPLLVNLLLFLILLSILMFIKVPIDKDNSHSILELSGGSFTLWLFILILGDISNTAFVIFVCSFIKSTSVSTGLLIAWMFLLPVIFIPVFILVPHSVSFIMGISVLPIGCLEVAFLYLITLESLGIGATWASIDESLPNTPGVNLGYVILMFLVDIVVYHSLAVYLEAILPSDYGVQKPWYYPAQVIIRPVRELIKKRRKGTIAPHGGEVSAAPSQSKATGFEPYHGPSTTIGVDVQNLVKKFDGNKIAVNGVCVKMYDGEIFALLGHNGAGKTTLISMLSGLFAPTSGTARVSGHDIRTDMDSVRRSLGLCPQHDMLFKNLTVMEHLMIFGQMKGQGCSKVKQEANGLLNMMRLGEKANTVSRKLSGGQKRKLCLAMALIGEAKVVILDEPTSGMDPEARRAIWDILLQIRGKRTILLTTHFMEEADVLGDRIGIMAEGKLQCCGSPSYLKSYFGTGYTLKVALLPGANKDTILPLIQKHVPDASLKPINLPNEVFISLPTETTSPSVLSSLFSALSPKKDELLIESLGLSVASMDEIFVKVGELSEKAAFEEEHTKSLQAKASVRTHKSSHSHHHETVSEQSKSASVVPGTAEGAMEAGVTAPSTAPSSKSIQGKKSKGFNIRGVLTLILMQSLAIVVKRAICTTRKIGVLIFQMTFPNLMVLCIVLSANAIYGPASLPPSLEITLDSYKSPRTFFSADTGLKDKVSKVIGPSAEMIKSTSSIKRALNEIAKSDVSFFREHVIIAAEISAGDYTVWFNTVPIHSAPLAINLASNIKGANLDPPMAFHVSNHPLQTQEALLMRAALDMEGKSQYIAPLVSICMLIALLGLAACFVNFPTEERLNKSKQLQLMTGIHPLIYLLITFLWDLVILLTVATLVISVFGIGQTYKVFSSYNALGVIFLIILIYGYAVIPLAYLISNIPGSITAAVFIFLVFLFIPAIIQWAVVLAQKPEASPWIRRSSLYLGIMQSFYYVGQLATYNGKCNFLGDRERGYICNSNTRSELASLRVCCNNNFSPKPFLTWIAPPPDNVFTLASPTEPGVGQYLMCFVIISVICQILVVVIELGGFRFLRSLMIKGQESDFVDQVQDEDVMEEKQRVYQMTSNNGANIDAMLVSSLCKNYGSLSAVSKLAFGVHHGECFGLLGTNGAGKTTTFRIITGDELQSLGDVYEGKLSLTKNRRKFISNIGYCPQFDAFVPHLTGKENLQLFARLRGVPCKKVNIEANQWLEKVGLMKSANVVCKNYSGGMKRRLSAAIAMIGNPALILLDEPTSGVDPVSRRQFWKVLESVKGAGKSIILTSHSMDECESLCSRLGIMVNGQLQCIGGVQHLKHKFARGYSLTLRLKPVLQPQAVQPEQFQFQQPQYVTQQVQQPQYSRQLQNPYEQRQPQSPQNQGLFTNPQMFQPPPQYQQMQMFQQANFNNSTGGEHLPRLHTEICEKFHPCTLKDQHETVLQYQIENTALGWDVIYKTLEDLKKSYGDIIEDYSVSETSLEEVFLAFSRAQYPPRDSKVPLCKRILTCQC